MGHAGAFRSINDYPASTKARRLSECGVEVVQHPTEFATMMPKLMERAGRKSGQVVSKYLKVVELLADDDNHRRAPVVAQDLKDEAIIACYEGNRT